MGTDIGRLLERVREGDETALAELVSAHYDDLRRIAARRLRAARPGHTLQTTALVHEAYLKLAGGQQRAYGDRAHFLAVASRVMRHILVDYARARGAAKRGEAERLSGEEWAGIAAPSPGGTAADILDLDAALDALAGEERNLARLIEMRYFGGMTAEELALVTGDSVHTVRRDIRLAEAWLRRKLGGG